MIAIKQLWEILKGWLTKDLFASPKPPFRPRREGSDRQSEQGSIQTEVEPFDLPVQNQTARTPRHTAPPAKVQLSSPFLLGLDDLTDLETYSNDKFLELMTWNCVSQTSSDTISVTSRSDGLSAPDILSTEDLLKTVKWDLEAAPSTTPEPSHNLVGCFLLGLEDVPLENLLTKNLLELIRWEGDNQTILPVQEEDLSLLEDLLGNFPE